MKVLVTGGTGFIGRHIVWRLAAKGCDVQFSGRNALAAAEVIRHSHATVRWVPLRHGTPSATDALTNASRGCTAIIHCAALSSPWGTPMAFTQANLNSTIEAIRACQANDIQRLVHLSTPSLYFSFRDRLNIREDEPLPPPVNEYAHSKRLAERCIQGSGLAEAVILRPRAVFGPWDTTLMPRLLRVIQRGPIPLMRGGHAQLDLTCIDNLLHAIELSLEQPLPRAVSTYNVSNGVPLTLADLLQRVAEQFQLDLRTRRLPWRLVDAVARIMEGHARLCGSGEPLLTRYGAGVLAFSQTLDLSTIRGELGYSPVMSLDEGIHQHARWWHQQGGLI